jgi:predicted amidohydrolase
MARECEAGDALGTRRHCTPIIREWQANWRPAYFVHGAGQLILSAGGHTLAPAICYESLQPNHADAAAKRGADIYLASVAKPQRNVIKAYEHYPQIARQHSLIVLMANSVGPCDDFVSSGQSAIWDASGRLVKSMDNETQGFVLFDTSAQEGSVILI